MESSESHRQLQLIRAELSSNPSLSEGTTTAKGLYANLYFVLTHYAFGGVSALCVLFALSTPLRLRGRTGVFRRREGPPRQPLSDTPFFRLLPFGLSPLRGVSSCRGAPPADPRFLWIRSPFFWSYVFFPEFVYAREVPARERSDVFSRPRLPVSSSIVFHTSSLLFSCSTESFTIGATGRVFPAAIVYLLAPSFPKVNSDRRYLNVDSELRREASCLRGGSWVSNVSRGEMFEGIVAPTFLGWDQHGLRCLLFGRLFKV